MSRTRSGILMPLRRAGTVADAGVRNGPGSAAHQAVKNGPLRCVRGTDGYPCTTDFAIMQWMPLDPFTVCVTRRSAARLHSV